ncbi:MAG TPA: CHRD domain-containing protein [Pseudomonadales bacterium]
MSRHGLHGLLALLLAIGVAGPAHARGGTLLFHATLTGEQEVPEVESPAHARALAQFDSGFTRLRVAVDIRGPLTVVAAHFHCGRPGTNGPVVFGILNPGPLVEIGNRVRVTLDNSAFTGADCTEIVGRPVNNVAALALAMRDGLIYINLHSPDNPTGEIRGQMLELGR